MSIFFIIKVNMDIRYQKVKAGIAKAKQLMQKDYYANETIPAL